MGLRGLGYVLKSRALLYTRCCLKPHVVLGLQGDSPERMLLVGSLRKIMHAHSTLWTYSALCDGFQMEPAVLVDSL